MRTSGVAPTSTKSSESHESASAPRTSTSALDEQGLSFAEGGNQSFVSLLGRNGSSTGRPPRLSTLPGGQAVQRKCAKCEEEEEDSLSGVDGEVMEASSPPMSEPNDSSDAAPSEPAAASEPAATPEPAPAPALASPEGPDGERESANNESPAPAASQVLLLDDNADVVGPTQMKKAEFLDALRPAVCGAVDRGLAGTGRTSDGCPHVDYWFSRLAGKDAAFIERSLQRYAPAARGAQSASEYIPAVANQVFASTQAWVRSGQVQGVPAELVDTTADGAMPDAVSSGLPARAVQLKARSGATRQPDDPATVRDELGGGRSLDGGVRQRMELAYGVGFGNVRIHTDSSGAELAQRYNARAFTVGEHVAFGAGEYRPGTMLGDALIAHELAHVVQQSGMRDDAAPMRLGDSTDNRLERNADDMAIGSLASLCGWAVSGVGGMSRRALGRLRSGLALQRCSTAKPKLTFSVQGGPTPTDCGGFLWSIGWTVQNATNSTKGIIVQKVDIERDVKDCAGTAIPYNGKGLNPAWYPMWEAWDVNGTNVTPAVGAVNDRFGQTPLGDSTKGRTAVHGTAEYYDNATLPSSFTVTNAPPAHSLPMTTSPPTIAGGTGSVDHSLTATWDCCTTNKATSITTSTPP
jgi:hypothetical protein